MFDDLIIEKEKPSKSIDNVLVYCMSCGYAIESINEVGCACPVCGNALFSMNK